MTALGFTSRDLECLPDVEGFRYEIIDGELCVSKTPHAGHQYSCGAIHSALWNWNSATDAGVALFGAGLIFSPDDDVIPDVIWVSRSRYPRLLDPGGHFRAAPELVVEVLSPGAANERRDRELKLNLYSRQGVQEYWIVDWRRQTLDVYRRQGEQLLLVERLSGDDALTSPLLPGFACPVSSLWTVPTA